MKDKKLFTISLTYQIFKNGILLEEEESKSFVKNFSNFIRMNFILSSNHDFVKTDGSTTNLSPGSHFHLWQGNSNNGVMLGTGTTLPSWNDYSLESDISGSLTFDGNNQTVSDITSGSVVIGQKHTITSNYTNNTGSTVNITEIGLVLNKWGSSDFYLFTRDVLTSSQTLLNGESITAKYNITIQV